MSTKSVKPFPVHTTLSSRPETIFADLSKDAFDFPFLDEGVLHFQKEFPPAKSVLPTNPKVEQTLPLKGFIFHTSHCGSTLLARMLNQKKSLRVVSEPEAINGLLLSQKLYDIPENEFLTKLEFIINSFCQKLDAEDGVVFKLTSWNVFFIRFFQKLFPSVPFLFLKREIKEVIDSQLKSEHGFQTWWNLPDQFLLKKFLPGSDLKDKQHFLKLMVEKHIEIGEKEVRVAGKIIDYKDLISSFGELTSFFDLTFTPEEKISAFDLTQFHSKKYPEVAAWK
jgi:hypothetical protein